MSQPRDDRQDDLFCPLLEEIINPRHPLVRLAGAIDSAYPLGLSTAPPASAQSLKAPRL